MSERGRVERLEELLAAAIVVLKLTFPSRQSPSINRIIDDADKELASKEV